MLYRTTNFRMEEFLCKHCGEGAMIVKFALLDALQRLRDRVLLPMNVSCGYRCHIHNGDVGGAPDSAHIAGEAADIWDLDGKLKLFCTPQILELCGLWAEDYATTTDWIHLQIRPASSRIFKP